MKSEGNTNFYKIRLKRQPEVEWLSVFSLCHQYPTSEPAIKPFPSNL